MLSDKKKTRILHNVMDITHNVMGSITVISNKLHEDYHNANVRVQPTCIVIEK